MRSQASAALRRNSTIPGVEPGLIVLFRGYVVIRSALGLVAWWISEKRSDPDDPIAPQSGVVVFVLLAALLFAPSAQRRLGRWFLPTALALATLGPIIESAATIAVRLDAGLRPNAALAHYWQPFFLLWVPLLLVAWQYRYRAVVGWSLATTVLEAALVVPLLERHDARVELVSALVLARGVLFAFVGLIVVKLATAQRRARGALADHAATLEQLATSRERTRLARELHDTLAHTLSATAVELEAVKALWEVDTDRAKQMLDRSLVRSRQGLTEARRAIAALRASPLEELGLVGALHALATEVHAQDERLAVTVRVAPDVGEVEPRIEQAVYRIADEALTNVARHSGASTVKVELTRKGPTMTLAVADDGCGFDPSGPRATGHIGLDAMRERAELVGGLLDVHSGPAAGTTIRFDVGAWPLGGSGG